MHIEGVEAVTHEMIKAAPPVAVSAMTFMGLCLQEWVYVVTITYTVIQIAILLRDRVWHKYFGRDRRNNGTN